MHPYIAAAMSRKRSGLAALDQAISTARLANSLRAVDRRRDACRSSRGVGTCMTAFVLGSVAQGAAFVLVAAALERRDVGGGWLAAVAAVRLAPYLVCSPVAGALAGRHGARTVFVSTGLGRGALMVALWIAVTAGASPLMLVSLLFALVGVGTPTFPALMGNVHRFAAPPRLDRLSALAAGLESVAFGAGPALGGLLLLTGSASSLLLCASTMVVSAGLATSLPTSGTAARPIRGRSRRTVRSAGRSLLGLDVRIAIVAVLGVNVLAGLNAALLARIPTGLDVGGERAFGLLSFVQGVGAFLAFIALLGPIRRQRRPLVPLAAAGAAVATLSATSDLYVAMVACCAIGASILTAEVLVTGTLGRSLPDALVAPAFGVLEALMVAAMVAGALVAPMLTDDLGLRPALAMAGIGTPMLAICSLRLGGRRAAR